MLLAVTLLADLNRLNVSWQVMPLPYPSTPAHVLPLLLLLLPFPYPRTLCRIMSVSVGSGASRRRHRGLCFGSFACCGAASAGLRLLQLPQPSSPNPKLDDPHIAHVSHCATRQREGPPSHPLPKIV